MHISFADYWYEPIEGAEEGEFVPVEVAEDGSYEEITYDNVEYAEPAQSNGPFGIQGGIALGPLKVNAGIGAGR